MIKVGKLDLPEVQVGFLAGEDALDGLDEIGDDRGRPFGLVVARVEDTPGRAAKERRFQAFTG